MGPSRNLPGVLPESLPSAFDSWFEARVPGVPAAAARAVLELCGRGAPAAFVASYRRDATGGLDARAVRQVLEAGEVFAKLCSRQAIILESIERHATLAAELRERILACFDPDALEDLYHPYRQQKKNRALAAREAGLGPLADWIWDCGHGRETPQPGQTLELWAFTFRNEDKGIPDAKSAIEGARDILVERLAGAPELRALVRRAYFEEGFVHGARSAKAKPGSRFEAYFAFHERVATLREPRQTHRYLALKRGLAEDELVLSIGGGPEDKGFEERLVAAFEAAACSDPESPGAEVLRHAGRIALKNDVRTSIENEVHRTLTDAAFAVIAAGFAESARRRLLEAPFGPRPVIGVDPGARGCRLAAVSAAGELEGSLALELATDEQKAAAGALVAGFARERSAAALAIGDGAGGRDFELVARAGLRAAALELPVSVVSEAGASGWAASEAARAELPDAEPALRAAVSIARRFQDPLAELVRLDPKALGGGQHHHEVPHALLFRALDAVIEDVVTSVGVDVNSAPRALLGRVPGVSPAAAAAIVEHRAAHGRFATRRELVLAKLLDEPAFEHAAGFLRVREGENALDATAVHPERHAALEALAARHGKGGGRSRRPGSRARARRAGAGPRAGAARARGRGAGARRRRPGPAARVERLRVPRRRALDRGAEARHGLPGSRHERHELRRVRGRGRPPGRPRPRLAAPAGAAGRRRRLAAGRPRRGAGAQGRPRKEAGLAHDETPPRAARQAGPQAARARGGTSGARSSRRSGRARAARTAGAATRSAAGPGSSRAAEAASPAASPAAPRRGGQAGAESRREEAGPAPSRVQQPVRRAGGAEEALGPPHTLR